MNKTQHTESTKSVRLPHWLSSILVAGLFLLVHVVAPWWLSLLLPRYGWVEGRPDIWNLLALIIVGAGIACSLWLISLHFRASPESFQEFRPIKKLLTPGPYTFSRNPMYLSELVFWFGWTLFYGSLAVFIGFLFWGVLFNFVIVPFEERDLEARFGEAYGEYKARVPRWIGMPRR